MTDTKTVRSLLRDTLTFVAIVVTCPLWAFVNLVHWFGWHDGCFLSCGQFMSLFPGLLGVFLRRGFYRMTLEQCERDAGIGFGAWFAHREARVGKAVDIGARCTIGKCSIGDYSLIGSNVDILSGRHQHKSEDPRVPRSEQGGSFVPVKIGRNTWIGNSSVIMADVGADSVIGAGSVVVKPIPPGCVAVGNPARVIRNGPATPHPTDCDAPEQ